MIRKYELGDTLRTGFFEKYNETLDEIIKESPVLVGSELRFPKEGGDYWSTQLGDNFYTKQEISSILSPFTRGATEGLAGLLRIATDTEALELSDAFKAITPSTLGFVLSEHAKDNGFVISADNDTLDLDTFTATGLVRVANGSTALNAPSGVSDDGLLTTYANGLTDHDALATQTYLDYTDDKTYVRKYISTTDSWTSWIESTAPSISGTPNYISLFGSDNILTDSVISQDPSTGFIGINKGTATSATEALDVGGHIKAGYFKSAVPDGLAPFQIISRKVNINLNSDLLDDQHGAFYRDASNLNAGTFSIDRHPVPQQATQTFTKGSYDSRGHLVSGSNPTTLAEMGILDGMTKTEDIDWARIVGRPDLSTANGTLNYLPRLGQDNSFIDSVLYQSPVSGFIGLGTTSPQASLDVRGNLWVRNADASYFGVSSTVADGVKIGFNNAYKAHIRYNNTRDVATFDGSGRMGVNKTDPFYTIDAGGDIRGATLRSYLSTGEGPPLVVYSTDEVPSLNSGMLQSYRAADFLRKTEGANLSGQITFNNLLPTSTVTNNTNNPNELGTVGFILQQAQAASNGMLPGQDMTIVSYDDLVLSGIQDIQGVVGFENMRVLFVGRTNPSENGPYYMKSGAWIRSPFHNTGASVSFRVHRITAGTYADFTFVNLNSNSATVGTTPLYYAVQSSGEKDPTVPGWVKGITEADAAKLPNVLVSTGSYPNPTWLTSLALSKLTGAEFAKGGQAAYSNPGNGLLKIGVDGSNNRTVSLDSSDYQVSSPMLKVVAAQGSKGWFAKTGDGETAADGKMRQYKATAPITIANSDGVDGDPTWGIDLPEYVLIDNRRPKFNFPSMLVSQGQSFSGTYLLSSHIASHHAINQITMKRAYSLTGATKVVFDTVTKQFTITGTFANEDDTDTVLIDTEDENGNLGQDECKVIVEARPFCTGGPTLYTDGSTPAVRDVTTGGLTFSFDGIDVTAIRWKTLNVADGTVFDTAVIAPQSATETILFTKPHTPGKQYTFQIDGVSCRRQGGASSQIINIPGDAPIDDPNRPVCGRGPTLFGASPISSISANGLTFVFDGEGVNNLRWKTLRASDRSLFDTGSIQPQSSTLAIDFNITHTAGESFILQIDGINCQRLGGASEKPFTIPSSGGGDGGGGGEVFTGALFEMYEGSSLVSSSPCGQSFYLPTTWKGKWRLMNVDYDRVVFTVDKQGVGQVYTTQYAGLATDTALHRRDVFSGGGDSSLLSSGGAGQYTFALYYYKNDILVGNNTCNLSIITERGVVTGNYTPAYLSRGYASLMDIAVSGSSENWLITDFSNRTPRDGYKWLYLIDGVERRQRENLTNEQWQSNMPVEVIKMSIKDGFPLERYPYNGQDADDPVYWDASILEYFDKGDTSAHCLIVFTPLPNS